MAAAAEPGLLAWSNAIRFTMSNDPGRQVFLEQVNQHGFLFLDDYLNNILSGAKQDPMIELVKTPARKKPAQKAHLSSKSGLSRIYSGVVSDDALVGDKDNLPVLNSFNQTLLNSKQTNSPSATPFASTNTPRTEIIQPIIPPTPPVQTPVATEPVIDANLSIIAEDEEMSERDPTVFHTPPSGRAPLSSRSSQMLDTNLHMGDAQAVPLGINASGSSAFVAPSTDKTLPPQKTSVEDTTNSTSLPSHPRTEHEPTTDKDTMPDLPAIPIVPSASAENMPSLQDKASKTPFPGFPGSAPFRKSIRLPQDGSQAQNALPLGVPTPGAPLGGKRTSWLKKAREVKAMESLTRVGASTSSHSLANPLKRKSDEATAGDSQITSDADSHGRHRKSAKVDAEQAASPPLTPDEVPGSATKGPTPQVTGLQETESKNPLGTPSNQEGMLDRLKKTVEGLGARVGVNFGTALGGGSVATALAEARAAAEARIAQRNSQEDEEMNEDLPPPPQTIRLVNSPAKTTDQDKRLSVSDLFPPVDSTFRIKSKAGTKSPTPKLQISPTGKVYRDGLGASPKSPMQSPISRQLPIPPVKVFDRPQPVFVPPVPSSPIGPRPKTAFTPQTGSSKSTFLIPSSNRGPTSPQREIASDHGKPYTAAFSEWPATSEDADFSVAFNTKKTAQQMDDDDDSWPIDEKLPPGVQWNFSAKDDSLTWSTLRSESQRGDTTTWRTAEVTAEEALPATPGHRNPLSEVIEEEDSDSEMDVVDLTENITNAEAQSNEVPRSTSQLSMASSQGSFSSTASRQTINPPGTSKKKPEVKKVLQMAAVAAKKQQEESDKKAARLKDMEARRQAAQQKKVEEEKQKAAEQERKMKEEGERRKREREETTEKRPLKQPVKKDEDTAKKRKIGTAETEKKELRKIPSKSVLKPSLKQPTVPTSTNSIGGPKPVEIKPSKPTTAWKGKAKAIPKMPANYDDDVSQPSQLVQTQMAARVETKIQASKAPERIQSEAIELPDINSEYSDSEDEDRKRTYDPPGWAQSPELREALRMQSTINPDDIFGAVKPLKMEEIFKSRTSRFRARTSSANWAGTDGLTLAEERDYARRMGFR